MKKPAPRRTRTFAASLGIGWLVGLGAVLGAFPALQLYRDFNIADWFSDEQSSSANIVTSALPPRAKQPAPYAPSASTLASEAAESRMRDVRRIQHELKRVGCYGGPIDGVWTDRTREAATTFTVTIGTSKSLAQPDATLLLLLEGQTLPACRSAAVAADVPKSEEPPDNLQKIAAKPQTAKRSNEPDREPQRERSQRQDQDATIFQLNRNAP